MTPREAATGPAGLRVAIVDDEPDARAAVRILLERRGGVDVVAECRNGVEAVEVLRWMTVDLLLLDVQMPGLDGFGVLHALGPARVPATIFVTAYDTYALRAFEVEALDYILKPFDETRFNAAFEKARRRIAERRTARWAERLLTATKDRDTGMLASLPRLAVPIGQRIIFVDFDHVSWIQASDQYVVIHAGAKEYLLRETLQHLAARLPRERFARIHRSHVVNLGKVRDLRRLQNGDGIVTLDDGQELRMSRRYRGALARRKSG